MIPRRSPPYSPTRRSRSSCTPVARTSRSSAARGRRRSPTSSTPRWRRASPASPPRPATPACCTTCCASASPKSASFTRWDARPLTPEQLRYAREDVEHLDALADEIQRRLRDTGRWTGRARSAGRSRRRPTSATPRRSGLRLPRISGLDAKERAIARELAAWRERTAAREDRPVGSIVRDPTLVELAKRGPHDQKQLGQIRGTGPDVLRRRARDILAAIERGTTRTGSSGQHSGYRRETARVGRPPAGARQRDLRPDDVRARGGADHARDERLGETLGDCRASPRRHGAFVHDVARSPHDSDRRARHGPSGDPLRVS